MSEAFIPQYFALNRLITRRKLEAYEREFELSDPDLAPDQKQALLDELNRLYCSIKCNEMMLSLGERYETNF